MEKITGKDIEMIRDMLEKLTLSAVMFYLDVDYTVSIWDKFIGIRAEEYLESGLSDEDAITKARDKASLLRDLKLSDVYDWEDGYEYVRYGNVHETD